MACTLRIAADTRALRPAGNQPRHHSRVRRQPAAAAPGRQGRGARDPADRRHDRRAARATRSASSIASCRPPSCWPKRRSWRTRSPSKAPIAVRYILDAVNHGLDTPFAQGQFLETSLFGTIASSDDMSEGTQGVSREAQGRVARQVMRIAIVVSRFNDFVTERLLDGAQAALARRRRAGGDVEVLRVPGAFEIPMAAQRVAETGKVDAVVCLGCLIRGATPHFEYIASACAHGITAAAADDRRADVVRRADDQLGRRSARARGARDRQQGPRSGRGRARNGAAVRAARAMGADTLRGHGAPDGEHGDAVGEPSPRPRRGAAGALRMRSRRPDAAAGAGRAASCRPAGSR